MCVGGGGVVKLQARSHVSQNSQAKQRGSKKKRKKVDCLASYVEIGGWYF